MYVNQSRILLKVVTITNDGDLTDNVTIIPSNGQINYSYHSALIISY